MKLVDDGHDVEGKGAKKTGQATRRIIGAKRIDSKSISFCADSQTKCSSEEARQMEKRKLPRLNKDPQLAVRFKAKSRRDVLKFPYEKEILEYLESVDRHYTYHLNIDKRSLLFAARLKCIWKLIKLQSIFRLNAETLLLAIHLFDCFLLKSMDHLAEINAVRLEKAFNLRSFILGSKPSEISIVDPLEATAIAAIFASGKFEEIDPPKLSSLLQFAQFDAQTIVQAECQIFECVNYEIHNPSEESYINCVASELALSSRLKAQIYKYIKIGLLFNFLRKHNPRIVILAIIKKLIDQSYENLKAPLLNFMKSLNISEQDVLLVSLEFFADLETFIKFSERNHLDILIVHLDNPSGA